MFNVRWLREFIRRHTNPIGEDRATLVKKRLSFMYAFIAWNAFGVVCYAIYNGKNDWAAPYKTKEENALTPAQQWSRTLGISDAKVYRVGSSGITNYEIHNESANK